MKSIFFLGMLAHYLRKLFLCESNHKSVFLKLNIDVLIEHFKFTDFLLSTYADTLFGTLSPEHSPEGKEGVRSVICGYIDRIHIKVPRIYPSG